MNAKNIERNARLDSLDAQAAELRARVAALENEPRSKYCGVWSEQRTYAPGDFVTRGGTLWIAKALVKGVPPGVNHSWQLIVKTKLDQKRDRVAQLQDVIAQQEIITQGIREQVLRELQKQIRADIRRVFANLLELLKQVEQQNIKLQMLHKQASDAGDLAGLPFVFPPELLRAWLHHANVST